MKKLLLLFFVMLMLFSCSTEEENVDNPTTNPPQNGQTPGTEQPVETFNFTAETTSVLAYKIVVLSSNNHDFTSDIYNAWFGEREVSLVRNSEGNLVFTIPSVESGEYSLNLTIDGKVGKIDFKVNLSQISDADAVITAELEEPLRILKQDVDALLSEGRISAASIDQLNSAKLMYSVFISKLSNLSDDEKMDIAKFFKANSIFSSHINNENRTAERAGENDFSCFRENAEMLVTSSGVLYDWEKVAIFIDGTGAEGMEGAGVGTYVGGYLAASVVLASRERLISSCTRPVSSSLVDEEGITNNFELTNNIFTSFQLNTGMRALMASDINDPNEKVSNTVENINQITASWEKTKTSLNTVTSNTSGWFNSWLPGNSEYEPFSSLQSLPDSSGSESLLEGNSEYVSISGLPSGVTADVEKDEGGKLKIRFNAPENTLPRDITGKIKYDDGVFGMVNDFAFTLSAAAYNYKLEIGHYNLDQSITTEKVLSQGDAITLPNNMSRYIRLTLEGEPISAGPNNPGGWYLWHFGDSNQSPVDSKDIVLEDYEIVLTDYLHAGGEYGINAYFRIDLILSNQSLRYLVENEYEISQYFNGVLREGPFKIKHNLDGTYKRVNADGSIFIGTYRIILGSFSREIQCYNYVSKEETIGAYSNDGFNMMNTGPGTFEVLEDGNLRAMHSPYACAEPGSGLLIKKL